MTGRTPNPGDHVRVTPNPFDGTLECDGSQGRLIQVRDEAGKFHAFGPGYATVEVISPPEPEVGTLRRETLGTGGYSLWQVVEDVHGVREWKCTFSTEPAERNETLGLVEESPAWTPEDPVPGTPAAAQSVTVDEVAGWHESDEQLELSSERRLTCPGCGSADPSVTRRSPRGPGVCADLWHGGVRS